MKNCDESGSSAAPPPQQTERKRRRVLHGELSISVHVELTKANHLVVDDLQMMEDGIHNILKQARKDMSALTQTSPWAIAKEQGCHITVYAKPVEVLLRLDKNAQ